MSPSKISSLSGLPLLAILSGLPLPSALAALPNGVSSGDVTDTSVVLWARSTQVGPIRFEWSESSDFKDAQYTLSGVTSKQVPAKTMIEDLKPATRYYFRAVDLSGKTAAGQFRTLAMATDAASLNFGVSGDIRPELAPYTGIRNAAAAGLDFFICMGDCIYAENYSVEAVPTASTLSAYQAKYQFTLTAKNGLNTWANLRAATAQFAVMDDHEVINDYFGGGKPTDDARFDKNGQYVNETLRFWSGVEAFSEYMPIADEFYGDTGNALDSYKTKLYRSRTLGQAAMMAIVDTRSFRDKPLTPVTDLSPTGVG
ncbi:MAG: alkaline phosphatase D family protein, partial [Methylococcaceae bacterium]